ncbi:MAG: rod shape-determining protein MreC [Robiginitomaculum sp.]|nr:rod shape-determining protein MreC [Robiginitomaculum sp.]
MAIRRSTSPFTWLRGFWTQASLVFLILISVVMLAVNNRSGDEIAFEGIREVADEVASPAMQVIDLPLSGLQNAGKWISSYWNSAARLRELEKENRNLRQWEALSHALHGKILRYEELLNMQGETDINVVSARMIAEARGPFVRSGLLRVGRTKGIVVGQAVVNPQGMIGRIVTVGRNSSRVLFLNDLNSRVPVTFEGATSRAIISGNNTRFPELTYVGEGFVPKIGTRISTSGDDGVLPSGLLVGEVIAPKREGGNFQVKLYANLAIVDFVQVLSRPLVITPEQEIAEDNIADTEPESMGQ